MELIERPDFRATHFLNSMLKKRWFKLKCPKIEKTMVQGLNQNSVTFVGNRKAVIRLNSSTFNEFRITDNINKINTAKLIKIKRTVTFPLVT